MSRYLTDERFRRCVHCGGIEGVGEQKPLTRKQSAIYDYLAAFQDAHGYAPTFDEIAEQFGLRSLATVHEHLMILERKGWIRRDYNLKRAITCLVPLAGAA